MVCCYLGSLDLFHAIALASYIRCCDDALEESAGLIKLVMKGNCMEDRFTISYTFKLAM